MTFIERQRQRSRRRQRQSLRGRQRQGQRQGKRLRLLARMACRQVATIVKCCFRERLLIESVSRVPEEVREKGERKARKRGREREERDCSKMWKNFVTSSQLNSVNSACWQRNWQVPPSTSAPTPPSFPSSFSSCSSCCGAMSFVVFRICQLATKARHLLMKPCGSQSNVEPKALARRLIALPWRGVCNTAYTQCRNHRQLFADI